MIDPVDRWYPDSEDLQNDEAGKLLPPLVAEIRKGVHEWRQAGYPGASKTSISLLMYWFATPHVVEVPEKADEEFQYFFAQREAVETAIWLYEVEKARDPYSLMRYDSSKLVSAAMFSETWTRYVFKMATGSGKTKVLALLIAWAYFHRSYEAESKLSRNFLLIAPNIIVLDRLLDDFNGLKIFLTEPVIPPNGYAGQTWKNDFQVNLHVQDEIGSISSNGNIFLTNIHRVLDKSPSPSSTDDNLTDYFVGSKPVTKTTQKLLDLGDIVRSIDSLIILNDEAHHIHDENLAWFRAIEEIDARMRQRVGHGVTAQFDVTATPKDQNGAIFAQTVCSYPLVEAIRQGVVKTPVVPDEGSRAKLIERPSDRIGERYADHIKLGYLEWAKRKEDLEKCGKKPVLFVMTTTTSESDEVANYIEETFADLRGKVLVIHTRANGDFSGKAGEKELELLREASRKIDSPLNPYQCVVSVLMLREGWDVQNVISMVGLRPYTAKSGVLPEQTLGRGLRRMFRGSAQLTEYVSVVGTAAFLDFVESVKSEGVELERSTMSPQSIPLKPLLIEVDHLNPVKDIESLDIVLPRLSGRYQRQVKNLNDLRVQDIPKGNFPITVFTASEQREIVFLDLDTGQPAWTTDLGAQVTPTSQAILSYLTTELLRKMRMVGGASAVYEILKNYIPDRLFDRKVDLDDLNILRNLSEVGPRTFLFESVAAAINRLTLLDVGTTEITSVISLARSRPVIVSNQEYLLSQKTVFNRIVGGSHLELRFAAWLDKAKDVHSFAKNTWNVHFFIEYVKSRGGLSHYYPDFIVRTMDGTVYIIETKGLEDLDVFPKWKRLKEWCKDATLTANGRNQYVPLYVSEEDFNDVDGKIDSMAPLVEFIKSRGPTGTT